MIEPDEAIAAKNAILRALLDSRGYGLEIMDRTKEATGGAIVLTEGNVYPILKALEREGLLRSYDGEPMPERGGRPRRYYELTEAGRRAVVTSPTAS